MLVHLLLALLYRSAGSQTSPAPVPALYVRCPSPFPQLEEFIHYATDFYHLNLHTITKDMRSALADFKSQQSQCRAIIIGTRRTDPHGNKLHDFDNTDVHKGWPDLMRVHPVLDWSYADVWAFLRCTDLYNNTGLPYCVLYDYGCVRQRGDVAILM